MAAELLDVAARTRGAWVALVASQNTLAALGVIEEMESASVAMAERLFAARNVSEVALTRQQELAEEARLERRMGLGADGSTWSVPDGLPGLPPSGPAVGPPGPAALNGRLDLAVAKRFGKAGVREWWAASPDLEHELGLHVTVGMPGTTPLIVGLPAPPCEGEECAHERHALATDRPSSVSRRELLAILCAGGPGGLAASRAQAQEQAPQLPTPAAKEGRPRAAEYHPFVRVRDLSG